MGLHWFRSSTVVCAWTSFRALIQVQYYGMCMGLISCIDLGPVLWYVHGPHFVHWFGSSTMVCAWASFRALIQVQYYGLIKQSTGEDWEDANISLSTAQPAIGGGAPHLPTKIVRFKRPILSYTSTSYCAPVASQSESTFQIEIYTNVPLWFNNCHFAVSLLLTFHMDRKD